MTTPTAQLLPTGDLTHDNSTNQPKDPVGGAGSEGVAQDQLRAFIERIERMEEEKAAIAADIKEIYAEAKGNGFDTKVIREIVRIRRQDANERMEHEAILELYMSALGMTYAPPEEE